jgi:hypothetical protein
MSGDVAWRLSVQAALSAAKISPSNTKTYTNQEVHDALRNAFGKRAFLTCQKGSDGISILNEVCLDE